MIPRTDLRSHEQTLKTASAKSIAQGLTKLSQFCTITEFYDTPGRQYPHMPESLAKALKCQRLSVLCLASANMRNPAMRYLATVVEACENLQRLDFSKTYIGDALMQQLAPALGKCTTLQSLDLTMCCLGRDGAHWLPGIFQPALTILKLSNNHVRTHTDAVVACFLHVVEHACCLADLRYHCAQLDCASAEVLAEGLGKCLGLSALHLNSNDIQATGAASIATALARCQGLSTLDLSYNKLGSQGAKSLAGALRGCAGLAHLDLSNIHAGTAGLSVLGGLLQHCSALLHLGLRGNGQHLDSQMHAVPTSGQRAHLMHLDLAASPCAAAMFQQVVVDHAPTLVHLDLERASMGFSAAFSLAMAMDRCGKLVHLNLGHNDQLHDDGVRAIAAKIGDCTALRDLNLESCNVQPGECTALAEGLKQLTALTRLNLENNKIGPGGRFRSRWHCLPRLPTSIFPETT